GQWQRVRLAEQTVGSTAQGWSGVARSAATTRRGCRRRATWSSWRWPTSASPTSTPPVPGRRRGHNGPRTGRLPKTLHLLAFIDVDETYRRQLGAQLTVQDRALTQRR